MNHGRKIDSPLHTGDQVAVEAAIFSGQIRIDDVQGGAVSQQILCDIFSSTKVVVVAKAKYNELEYESLSRPSHCPKINLQ